MICIIAMVVFGILSIFSAKYRPIAKEAFDCVFRRVTLRKCESGLDIRLKTKIVGKLMNKHYGLAKGVHKYFEIISWMFVVLFFVSLFFTGQGIYNIIVYDNCYGPIDENGFFILTGTGGEVTAVQGEVEGTAVSCEDPLCKNGTCEKCGEACNCTTCVL